MKKSEKAMIHLLKLPKAGDSIASDGYSDGWKGQIEWIEGRPQTEMNSVSYSIGGGGTMGEREKEQMREHT